MFGFFGGASFNFRIRTSFVVRGISCQGSRGATFYHPGVVSKQPGTGVLSHPVVGLGFGGSWIAVIEQPRGSHTPDGA